MKKYERPMVIENAELSEGVYAASGDVQVLACVNRIEKVDEAYYYDGNVLCVGATIHYNTEGHINDSRKISFVFNKPVTLSDVKPWNSNGNAVSYSGEGTNTITVTISGPVSGTYEYIQVQVQGQSYSVTWDDVSASCH